MTTFERLARLPVSIAFASVVFCATAAELPPLPEGLTAQSKPVHMPAFNLSTPAGGAVRADEFNGKVVIARFWATW
jgi:hypothetical protein